MAQPAQARIQEKQPHIALNIFLWMIQLYLAYTFLQTGWAKLRGQPFMVELFNTVGLGQWFRYVTGAIELGSGILSLIPGMAGIAAALLGCTMIGAIVTHLTILHSSPMMPVILLVGAAIVLWGRWGQVKRRFA